MVSVRHQRRGAIRARALLIVIQATLVWMLVGASAVALGAGPAGPSPEAAASATASPTATARYRIAIPRLGLSQQIYDWGCRGGQIPNRVYYWGCAGRNNLYLLGHAWGVFKPIHDAYRDRQLRPGLPLTYIDKYGRWRHFHLSWVRMVHWTQLGTSMWGPGRTWAWNATSSQVITLQTCYGSSSQYRIVVRFVEDAG